MKVLHAAAEAFPLVKTGGLADVLGALPPALAAAGADVRMLLPGYPAVLDALKRPKTVATAGAVFGAARVTILQGRVPPGNVPAYVIDAPYLFRRPGNPYHDAGGRDWSDNLQRFALLGWVAAHLGGGDIDPAWVPEVVHAHDWHAGMACAYVAAHPGPSAATVFTIHNLGYQGLFPHHDFPLLGLPWHFMQTHGVEYHGQLSFMKAGLKYARRITTVSPSYAREIATHEFGCGLDGVIRSRRHDVSGILNGIDTTVWNPEADAALAARYSAAKPGGKAACKAALQAGSGLDEDPSAPLVGLVSRLTEQKGLDLLLAALPELLAHGLQLAVLGSGDAALESAFAEAARAHPGRVSVQHGYDEALAHRIVAGADVIAVPSRFEPCGLTQLYGLRYGTLPVVHRVGGLADTVADGQTGFVFDAPTPAALAACLLRAAAVHRDAPAWAAMQRRAMDEDHSWRQPAQDYLSLYRALAPQAEA